MTRAAGGASGATRRRSLIARARRLTVLLAAVSALALLASACGSSSGEGVARVDTTETTTTGPEPADGSQSADPTAYSACMRKNGVPEFPDPNSDGTLEFGGEEGSALDPNSPQFKAADEACKALHPKGGKPPSSQQLARQLREALQFAACMRAHGVPSFPDPKVSGGAIDGGLIDPSAPQFDAAQQACRELPGARGMRNSPDPEGNGRKGGSQ